MTKVKSTIRQYLPILIFIFTGALLGCDDEYRSVKNEYNVTYSVQGTVSSCTIRYSDEDGTLRTVESVELPWDLTIAVPSDMAIRLLLSVDAGRDEVFIPFLEGTATAHSDHRLIDSAASFSAAVEQGDCVFAGDDDFSYAEVSEVVSDGELMLNRELFPIGNETYAIYREKTISLCIRIDDELSCQNTASDLFSLSALTIGRLP